MSHSPAGGPEILPLTPEFQDQITHAGKACANKIVSDQTAPKEQSDLGLFVCLVQQSVYRMDYYLRSSILEKSAL